MRVEDLHHKELLELDPEGGVIRFAGQRALLVDAVEAAFELDLYNARCEGELKTYTIVIK